MSRKIKAVMSGFQFRLAAESRRADRIQLRVLQAREEALSIPGLMPRVF